MAARLAIEGGTPVIAESIPGGMHGAKCDRSA